MERVSISSFDNLGERIIQSKVGFCPLWILSFVIDMMEMKIEPSVNVHFVFTFHFSMELVDAHFNETDVEDATPNDVEEGYYCPRLGDHLESKPLDILTSSSLEIEM